MPLNNNGIGVQMFVRVVSAPLSVPRRGAAPTGGTAPGVPRGDGCKKAARGGSLAQPGLLFVMSIFTVLSFYGTAVTGQGSEKNLVGLVTAYADVNTAFCRIVYTHTLKVVINSLYR